MIDIDAVAESYLTCMMDAPLPTGDGRSFEWWLLAMGDEIAYLWNSQTQGTEGEYPNAEHAWSVGWDIAPNFAIAYLVES